MHEGETTSSRETLDPQELLRRIHVLARAAAQRRRLPLEDVSDIVQEAYRALLQSGVRSGALRAAVEHAARTTARLRARPRPALRPPARRELPRLCPRLAALATRHPEPRRFLAWLRRAAVRTAHEPRSLQTRQLRAFLLAYDDGRPLPEIARLLGLESEPALARRLRRASARVERRLLAEIRSRLPVTARGLLRALGEAGDAGRKSGPARSIVENTLSRIAGETCVGVGEALAEISAGNRSPARPNG